MTIDEARDHIGEHVIYSAVPGQAEEGAVVRVGRKYVYVQYLSSPDPVATCPENLVLMRCGSVAEHFRLNMAEPGFPVRMHGDGLR
jgi:hypothetical protein